MVKNTKTKKEETEKAAKSPAKRSASTKKPATAKAPKNAVKKPAAKKAGISKKAVKPAAKKPARKKEKPMILPLRIRTKEITPKKEATSEKKVADEPEVAGASVEETIPMKSEIPIPVGAAQDADKCFARWTGKSFLRTDEEVLFYKISLLASIAAIIFFLKEGSWLAVITFLTLVVILIFELKDKPREAEYEVNIDGISIDGRLYRFDDIHSFELAKKGEYDIVKLQMKNSLFPVRELHLAADQDILYIETLLEYFLPQEVQEEQLFNFRRNEDGRGKRKVSEDEFIEQKVSEYMEGRP